MPSVPSSNDGDKKMELLKLCICGDVYEFEVVEDYLQKALGTFIKQTGCDKLNRNNWDNSEFFNYQSKPCFTVCVDSIRRKVDVSIMPTEEEKRSVINSIEEKYYDKSNYEIEEITRHFLKKNSRHKEKQFRIKQYCTVKAYFLDGAWRWKTEYTEKDLRQSMKRENCKPYLTRYIYTGEKLGICGKMPGDDIFEKLFKNDEEEK